ncbi:nicotinate (nicotinamide) nucleotide adenylyltransferase [candidate division KSB1 bacterium]
MAESIKTGLYFGSFNPIHTGHLIIANHMVAFTDLNQLWFVVSPHNPLKEKKSLLADNHRLAMVKVAIDNDPRFRASDIEFGLPTPSFTIDTLIHLEETYPNRQFVIIMGSDSLATIDKWKNPQLLLENYTIYVYPRPDSDGGPHRNHHNVKFIDAPLIEISSSFIRKALGDKRELRYMLPEKVYDYILEMHFYEK